MSLLGALNRSANRPGPIVVDTPFGRLDPKHRLNILMYIPNMGEQIVFLVHEGEINKETGLEPIATHVGATYQITRINLIPFSYREVLMFEEPTTIGLSAKGHAILVRLREDEFFAEMLDAYRFAIALGIAHGSTVDAKGSRQTIFNVGTLDPDQSIKNALKALHPILAVRITLWRRNTLSGVSLRWEPNWMLENCHSFHFSQRQKSC